MSVDVITSMCATGEGFAVALQRMDKEMTRSELARRLRISRRHLYRLLQVYEISEYRRKTD